MHLQLTPVSICDGLTRVRPMVGREASVIGKNRILGSEVRRKLAARMLKELEEKQDKH